MPSSFASFSNGDVVEASHVAEMHAPIQNLERGAAFYAGTTGGSSTAYSATLSPAPDNPYQAGMIVNFKIHADNTAGSPDVTLNVNGVGAKPILKGGGDSLAAGDLKAGQMASVVYDSASGGAFKLVAGSSVGDLDDLTDVAISSPSTGQVVRYNGSQFVNANLAAGDMPGGIDASKIGGGAISNTEFGYLDGVTSAIQTQINGKAASIAGVPVGAVMPFAGSSAPTGWLLCAGQYVSQSTYGTLYAALGSAGSPYGVNGPASTFAVPDLRGRVAAGKDNMGGSAANRLSNSGTGNPGINAAALGQSGGADRHQLTSGQMPQHRHYVPINSTGGPGGLVIQANYYQSQVAITYTDYQGNDENHPNCQPTIILNYIIYAGV